MKLSILMPCLNEAETLASCIKKAKEWLSKSGTIGEILVADNGSSDGSQEIALRNGARVVNVPVRGYGAALYHGAMAAQGKLIIMGDSDDSYDFSNLDAFIEKLDQGFDLVMGNRFSGGIDNGAMPWKNKYIGNPILSWIGRKLFNCPANDFHCGIRGFSKKAFLDMDLRTTGMEFASEMVIKANLFGMKITEVPTRLAKDGRSRPPHLRPWRDGWRHLRFMMLFSPKWLFIIPGLSVFIATSLLYFALIYGPQHIGRINFDVHTLFYAQAGMTIGFTSSLFGLVINIFGAREGLLPNHAILEKLRTSPILEIGSFCGITLIFSGLYSGLFLVTKWANTGYGPLQNGALLRSVSLSTLMITLGGIILLFSLIMGFLSLPTRTKL